MKIPKHLTAHNKTIRDAVMSGDDAYDVTYASINTTPALVAAGASTVSSDKDGNLYYSAGEEHYFSAVSALAALLDESAGSARKADDSDFDAASGGYMYIFTSGRSLFLTAEIKAAQLMRDVEMTFGIVPLPKLDEQQESYYVDCVNTCTYSTIPNTNTHLTETAAASDYISYLGNRDVLPVDYGNVMEQKGLRNEDSVEMLDIVLSSKTIDIATLFGWNNVMYQALRSKLFAGDDGVASTIEKYESKIGKSIEDTLSAIADTKANS